MLFLNTVLLVSVSAQNRWGWGSSVSGGGTPQASTCKWLPWGAWAECKGVCGSGVQTRIRRCIGGNPGSTNAGVQCCPGKILDTKSCANPTTDTCSYWSGWGEWSAPEKTCFESTRTKTRTCFGRSSDTCLGSDRIIEKVKNPETEWSPPTQASPCSVSCGHGQITSHSTNPCYDQPRVSYEPCVQPCCSEWLQWAEWSACSTSCFTGQRTRSRANQCSSYPDQTEAAACESGEGVFSDWMCAPCNGRIVDNGSVQCQGSIQCSRKHSCYNSGRPSDIRGAALVWTRSEPCGEEGYYVDSPTGWTPCTKECRSDGGITTLKKTHVCTNQVQSESKACGIEGVWGTPTAWSACSNSCGGLQYRTSTHQCQKDSMGRRSVLSEDQACGAPSPWSMWGAWTACTATCPGATTSRLRHNVCGVTDIATSRTVYDEREVVGCPAPIVTQVVSPWTQCSASCGRGIQIRTHTDPCTRQQTIEEQPCELEKCCEWMQWSGWSNCPLCGGTQKKLRSNNCTDIEDQILTRNTHCTPSADFHPPSDWSACSSSCPGGSRYRTAEAVCPIQGWRWNTVGWNTGGWRNVNTKIEYEKCGGPGEWGAWTTWTTCSRSCGTGQQTRTRTHSCRIEPPQVETVDCQNPPVPNLPWEEWSRCSQSCPGGKRSRVQRNACLAPIVDTESCGATFITPFSAWSTCYRCATSRSQRDVCTGDVNTETERCEMPWGQWTIWSVCSDNCAGTMSRSRNHACPDIFQPESESKPCGTGPYNTNYGPFGMCTKTCTPPAGEPGVQMRTAKGMCGAADQIDSKECNTFCCDVLLPWTDWVCSVTCGAGTKTRTRTSTCSNGEAVATGIEPCFIAYPELPWGEWGACKDAAGPAGNILQCGRGIQEREREINCSPYVPGVTRDDGKTYESQQTQCDTARCPYWSGWTHVDCELCDTQVVRTRTCVFESATLKCKPDMEGLTDTKMSQCAVQPDYLKWDEWSLFSACSVSCGGGFRTRSRGNKCSAAVEEDTEIGCNADPGAFGPWSDWTDCSMQTCGTTGVRTSFRVHSCTGEVDNREIQCVNDPGAWGPWTNAGGCTVTCGGGLQAQQRQHSCTLELDYQQLPCNMDPGTWALWETWSACSQRCISVDLSGTPVGSTGFRFRRRGHTCGSSDDQEEEECGNTLCPYWTEWVSGPCSVSCFAGKITRTRRCQGGVAGVDCPGDEYSFTDCYVDNVAGAWSDYSACSVTCKGGKQVRSRPHSCLDREYEEKLGCNPSAGTWLDWSPYTTCSAACGVGSKVRTRGHNCGEPLEREEVPCVVIPDEYSQWSEWGSCSKTCGGGIQTRTKTHSCTGKLDPETRTCATNFCAYFGAWSNWGPCSKSCGVGTMNRQRYCHGGIVGSGLCIRSTDGIDKTDVAKCDMGKCCEWDWSGWTGCCRNDIGQNVRLRFKGNTCGLAQENLSKPCESPSMSLSATACTILMDEFRKNQQLGHNSMPYQSFVNVANPDTKTTGILQGQKLGHTDTNAQTYTGQLWSRPSHQNLWPVNAQPITGQTLPPVQAYQPVAQTYQPVVQTVVQPVAQPVVQPAAAPVATTTTTNNSNPNMFWYLWN